MSSDDDRVAAATDDWRHDQKCSRCVTLHQKVRARIARQEARARKGKP